MPAIAVGKTIPTFTLPDQNGKPFASKTLAGELAVIYFYPKADTSSCTKEACAFSEALPLLGKLGARVVGISPDPSAALKKFDEKYKLGFTLLGDVPAGEGAGAKGKSATPRVIDAFGVWGEKSMYGNTYMGVIRTTLLVDAGGKVVRVWENVKVPGHAAEVMEAIAELKGSPAVKVAKKAKVGKTIVKKTAKKAARK